MKFVDMMKKNLQKCLRNWGKPTISNKEIKVIGRFKVRLLKYVVTQQMSPRADNFF